MGTKNHTNIVTRLCAFIMAAFAMFAAPVFAQTESADADALVITPLSLVKTADLDFGTLIAGPTGGTAVVSPAAVRTTTGGVTAAGGTPSNAEFKGYGYQGRYVYVSTTQPTYTLVRNGGAETVLLSRLTLQADNLTPRFFPGLFQINSSSIITLRIGGTLTVGPLQAPGVYEGTFPITMDYY